MTAKTRRHLTLKFIAKTLQTRASKSPSPPLIRFRHNLNHEIQVVDEVKYPHLSAVKNVFIRGSVVRYVHLPANAVDTALLEDATRREAAAQANKAK
ncbi:hypothetical protein TWF703_001973 [Orbilia oligospora]|uniref:LSM domain-containing protein n=1 Tax=Orbilia oligospora TaxID=2813651 RepID=A0A7C8NH98_ORBOL|nr:hypothetical protein TWF703_001973 [Orbilia oligospora]